MKLTLPGTVAEGQLNGVGERLDEVRTVLGHEVDRLAQLAAQVGRDASAQATTVGRDTSREGRLIARRLADRAAIVGPALALMGRQRMRGLGRQARAMGHDLGRQAQSLGHELRQVRLTTEPRRTGRDMLPGVALVGGLGIGLGTGLALMYLLDGERGKRRRQMLRGRLSRITRQGREAAAGRANAFANRTVGVMADVRRTVTTGIGIDQGYEPSPAALEEWPEGTRVPVS